MLQSLSYGLCLLLILAGLFFLFYIIVNCLLFRTGKDDFYTVVIGKRDDAELADKVYSAFIQANSLNFSCRRPVYIVDCGLTKEQKQLCTHSVFPDGSLFFIHGECIGTEDEYIVICLDKE